MATIWYVSKYVTPPYAAKVGARGFMLLREFARLGHNALLITSDSNHLANPPALETPQKQEVIDGVCVHWLRTSKYSEARSLRRIISWFDFEWRLWRMRKNKLPTPDVVIVSSLSLLTVFNGLVQRWRYGSTLVFEVRDIWPLTLIEVAGISRWHPLVLFLQWVERIGYRRADVIVSTLPNLQEHVLEVSKSSKPVFCIPQGLDPELLRSPQPVSKEYVQTHIPSGKFIVCYAGTIGAANALHTLVDCASMMSDRQDIHFLIVGDGALKVLLKERARLLTNITFAPAIPKESVQAVLAHADVLYFAFQKAQRLRFGQSLNKMIDYMLAGKPVLASFTGYYSMIDESSCGSFVPAEDADTLRIEIERYAAMPTTELNSIGARGREWILNNRQYRTLAQRYLNCIGISE